MDLMIPSHFEGRNMPLCFLDIETRATDNPLIIKRITDKVRPPGSMKKPETISNWWAEEGAAVKAEAVARTALDGTWGRIASIAWVIDDDDVFCVAGDDERVLLNCLKSVITASGDLQYVAFNGDFDFRFIRQRAIINRIKMPWLPQGYKDFYDPMKEWAGYREYISQVDLEMALGIERQDAITGADVGKHIDCGDWETVKHHNIVDVTNLREIHRRLTS